MKRKIFIAALLTVFAAVFLTGAFPASAGKFSEFKNFTVELPNGWVDCDNSDPESECRFFTGTDGDTALIVVVRPAMNLTSKEFAEGVSGGVNGTKPMDNGDDLFKFTYKQPFEQKFLDCRAIAGVKEKSGIFVIAYGNDTKLPEIVSSLRFKLSGHLIFRHLTRALL